MGETVEQYDEHFWRNGHSSDIDRLRRLEPGEPGEVLSRSWSRPAPTTTSSTSARARRSSSSRYLNQRLRDKRLEGLVRNLFRPSYGGNRNFTLMYTLGGLMVSSDDDMRPYALMEDSPESLRRRRGQPRPAAQGRPGRIRAQVVRHPRRVPGRARQAGRPRCRTTTSGASCCVDTAMDLETNATKGLARENSLILQRGAVADDAVVKMAQTFRSGTNDIDAIDFVDMFLDDEDQIDPDELNDLYVLVNFRPVVTNKNWRMDCGVAGYDNTFGLPPFFPTRLRFEDYIYRLWVQQDGVVAAHVDAAQNHTKQQLHAEPARPPRSSTRRCANLLKRKIKAAVTQRRRAEHRLRLRRRGDRRRTRRRSSTRSSALHAARRWRPRSRHARASAGGPAAASRPTCRRRSTASSRTSSSRTCSRIVDDVVSRIKGSIELWPTLVEICYFQKRRRGLPQTRVQNKKLKAGIHAPAGKIGLS